MNVRQIPLTELHTPEGASLRRVRHVTTTTIKEMICCADVRFAVANVGAPLMWVSKGEKFVFWKSKVRGHVADGDQVRLDEFPGGYFYFASEWRADQSVPEVVILLEKYH